MPIDPTNNQNMERSPCHSCPTHLARVDKRLCIGQCKRLKAYREEEDWTKEDFFIVPEGKQFVEGIQLDFDLNSKKRLPSRETGWKKAMPKKKFPPVPAEEQPEDEVSKRIICGKPGTGRNVLPVPAEEQPEDEVSKCLICGKPGTDQNVLRRGLCVSPCYGAWYKGGVLHPVIGAFRKMSREELTLTRRKELPICLMDGCDSLGRVRGLCQKHYRAWQMGKIVHPALGEFVPKFTEDGIFINIHKYPKLMRALKDIVDGSCLPIEVIVVSLLDKALKLKGEHGGDLPNEK